MSLVRNERAKLLAAALNTAATSSFTVGVLAPAAAALYGLGPAALAWPAALWIGVGWFVTAVILHLAGQAILGRLRP